MAGWTPRMQQVSDLVERYEDEHGCAPSYGHVGRQIGLSRERVRQILHAIERYRAQARISPEERAKRLRARYARTVLKALEQAARSAARARRPRHPKPPHIRTRPWSPWKLYEPPRPLTQIEMQELAKTVHWSRVVYESGTDRIVRIEGRY